jgi:exosortase/archaeosortase family protein
LNGADVLVDLPCSGARGLLQLLLLFACLGAVIRPRPRAAIAGLATVLVSGFASNVIRISVLAVGIGYRNRLGTSTSGVPGGLVGLLSVAPAARPVVGAGAAEAPCRCRGIPAAGGAAAKLSRRAVVFLAACAAVVSMP